MKNLLTILLILLPFSAHAWGVVVTSGGVAAPAGFCSTCTGSGSSPAFCWEVATDTESISTDGGCVVSGGDATGTANSAIDITAAPAGKTGYSATWSTSNDYYLFDVSSDDLIDDTIGTITFDVYITDLTDSTNLIRLYGAGTDQIIIEIFNTDELRLSHEGADASNKVWTTDNNLQLNTWYSVVVKWTTADVNPNMSIAVTGITPGIYATTNTNLTAFTTQAGANGFRIGNDTGSTSGASIKNIKVYKSWLE